MAKKSYVLCEKQHIVFAIAPDFAGLSAFPRGENGGWGYWA
jgi:hypothetical protein